MASLKDIKNHINSVRSTLKITSAMKMVASAKLRKAQQAVEAMRPYEAALHSILAQAGGKLSLRREAVDEWGLEQKKERVALVVLSSNSSLCGGFNANVIRAARAAIARIQAAGESVTVMSLGRKVEEALRKDGFPSPADYRHIVGKSTYEDAAALAQTLLEGYMGGEWDRVELIYNHFVNTASQKVVQETYLPFDAGAAQEEGRGFIIEPDPEAVLKLLLPKVIRLKLYTVVLDSVAAEHAARTVAMQTATENGEELLQSLTLEYNKSRQQKITAEILDLVGGSLQ